MNIWEPELQSQHAADALQQGHEWIWTETELAQSLIDLIGALVHVNCLDDLEYSFYPDGLGGIGVVWIDSVEDVFPIVDIWMSRSRMLTLNYREDGMLMTVNFDDGPDILGTPDRFLMLNHIMFGVMRSVKSK